MVGDDVHGTKIHTSYTRWISNITVKVRKDATAGDVITKGLKAKGYEAEVNAEYNYITAITTPTGTKLAAYIQPLFEPLDRKSTRLNSSH